MYYYRKVRVGNRTLLINHTLGKVVRVTKNEPLADGEVSVTKQQFKNAGWSRKETQPCTKE